MYLLPTPKAMQFTTANKDQLETRTDDRTYTLWKTKMLIVPATYHVTTYLHTGTRISEIGGVGALNGASYEYVLVSSMNLV